MGEATKGTMVTPTAKTINPFGRESRFTCETHKVTAKEINAIAKVHRMIRDAFTFVTGDDEGLPL